MWGLYRTFLFSILKDFSNPNHHDILQQNQPLATEYFCGKRLPHLSSKGPWEWNITFPHLNALGFQGILECYLSFLGGGPLNLSVMHQSQVTVGHFILIFPQNFQAAQNTIQAISYKWCRVKTQRGKCPFPRHIDPPTLSVPTNSPKNFPRRKADAVSGMASSSSPCKIPGASWKRWEVRLRKLRFQSWVGHVINEYQIYTKNHIIIIILLLCYYMILYDYTIEYMTNLGCKENLGSKFIVAQRLMEIYIFSEAMGISAAISCFHQKSMFLPKNWGTTLDKYLKFKDLLDL